jgi:hypothetical protein
MSLRRQKQLQPARQRARLFGDWRIFRGRSRLAKPPLLGPVNLYDDSVLDDDVDSTELQPPEGIANLGNFPFTGILSRGLGSARFSRFIL